jgi:hypothetical protein
MFGVALLFLCFVGLIAVIFAAGEHKTRMGKILVAAFVLRMVALAGARNIQLFSHVAGGDANLYEEYAGIIAFYWDHHGVQYMTMQQMPELGRTTLPPNLFALIMYTNGGPTLVGCTAVCALTACLTLLNFLKLADELGADRKMAERVTMALLFAPSFMLYTSDMYKDGLVWFFTLGAVGSAFRLSRRFSLIHVVFGVLCLWACWYVRYYLVFVCLAPLAVGFLGIGSKSLVRIIFSTLGLGLVLAIMLSYTRVLNDFGGTAQEAYDLATNHTIHKWNALAGGSGVTFDDGGRATGAIHWKVIYTLFAPFPWQGGSMGLQIGKIDTIMFYYFMYRSVRGSRRLWREDRALLIAFLAFLVPLVFAYATSVSNIGLILRQRMPVVLITALLATLSWPKQVEESEEEEATEDEDASEGEAEPAEAAGE